MSNVSLGNSTFGKPGATNSANPAFTNLVYPQRHGPLVLGTVKSVLVSGKYQIPGLFFTNSLGGGNYLLDRIVLNVVPGGVPSQVRFYIWPASAQGTVDETTGFRQNDLADYFAIWTAALNAESRTVSGKSNSETLIINCYGIPIEPGDSLVCHSDTANNNVMVATILREI